jgi:putative oligomerization/nucleic acid binding protein
VFVRRRPLLRAAVVGGGAYMVGKRRGQQAEQESGQQPGQQQPAQQQPVPSQPSQQQVDISDKLAQLSSLHSQGSLSDAEFAAAKAKLLGS